MNVVPHPALTVVARHNWNTTKDDIRIIKSHIGQLKTAAYVGYNWTGLDAKFDLVEMDLSSATVITGTGGVTCDTLRLTLPKAGSNQPPYPIYPLKCRRLEITFGRLSNGMYLFNGANQTPVVEEIEITGAGAFTQLPYMCHYQNRLYHLRIDSLANVGTMQQAMPKAILDKPSVLHLRDSLKGNTKTGIIAIGIASRYADDIDVQQAIADIRAQGRTVQVTYNTVPTDLWDKVYRYPIKTE